MMFPIDSYILCALDGGSGFEEDATITNHQSTHRIRPQKWRLHISGWLKSENADLGGGNSNIFYVHPENWGRWTHFDSYFSEGLKPPTKDVSFLRNAMMKLF